MAELGSRQADIAERSRGGRHAGELFGQRAGLLAMPDARFEVSGEGLGTGELGERDDELRAGRQRLQESDGFRRQVRPIVIRETVEDDRESAHRERRRAQLALGAEGCDGLLQRLGRLERPAGMQDGLAVMDKRRGPFRIAAG